MGKKTAIAVIICVAIAIAIPAILFAQGLVAFDGNEAAAACRRDYRQATKEASSSYANQIKELNSQYKLTLKSLKDIADKTVRIQEIDLLKDDKKETRRQLTAQSQELKDSNLKKYRS